jgi:internalin A
VPDQFVIEETPQGQTLVVTGAWSGQAQALVESGDVAGLVLNYARGFKEPSLDFLEPWPLRGLDVLDRTITDLTPIARLGETLEDLAIQAAPHTSIDLGSLPRLRSIAALWETVEATFHGPDDLREVVLIDYHEANLSPIAIQPAITRVVIKGAPILETLDGAEAFARLGVLRVGDARELGDLSALGGTRGSLIELKFETCLGISSLDELATLANLRVLGISDCGRIASLHPIADMSRLETLYAWGSTRIEDGDLTPLLALASLREVRMRDRRDYEPPLASVREALRGG